jgi:hypothetical protein
MQAYISQIIYRIKCATEGLEQYDEQYRLVYAADERDALARTQVMAREEEAAFVDRHGRTVAWELVAIKDLQPVEIRHGSLLFSAVKEIEPIAAPVWAENLSC